MKIKTIGFALMATAALVGCQNQDDNNDAAGDPNENNVEQTRFNDGDGNATNIDDRNNRQDFDMNDDDNDNRGDNNGDGKNEYDVSEKAADKVTDNVKGIDSAYVVTTENNAYVAVDFDTDDNDDNNNNVNNTNNGTTGATDGKNGTTGNNNQDNGDQLTDDIKQKVSDTVKSVDKDIDNVYVSTNPDFLDSVKNFADQADNGEPIEGLFDQMGNMIERVFPQNK